VRAGQLQGMVDRAREPGEKAPGMLDIVDHLLAPTYVRVLFGTGPLTWVGIGQTSRFCLNGNDSGSLDRHGR
jgi:hypothetical protein